MKRSFTYLLYSVIAVVLVLSYTSCVRAGASGGDSDDESADGSTAVELSGALVVQALSELPEPSAENTGELYFVVEDDTFYYSNGTEFVRIDLTGPAGPEGPEGPEGPAGDDGADGADGTSIVWQGARSRPPSSPETNWAYYNTADGVAYIWNGRSWEVLARDGENAVSLNTRGAIRPGGYLRLSHNLNRADLTFTGQFTKSGFLYDYHQYADLFAGPGDMTTYPPEIVFDESAVDHLAAATLTNGNVVVVYADGGSRNHATFAIIDPSGAVVVEPTEVSAGAAEDATVAALHNGGFVMAWSEFAASYFALYDAAGQPQLADPFSFADATEYPAAVALSDGSFAIAFYDVELSQTLFLVADGEDGSILQAPATDFPIEPTICEYLSATAMPDRGFVVAYQYVPGEIGTGAYRAVEYIEGDNYWDAGGQAGQFDLSTVEATHVSAATLTDGSYAIAYQAYNGEVYSGNFDIYTDDGVSIADDVLSSRGETTEISIAPLEDGAFAIAYRDVTAGAGRFAIYSRWGSEVSAPQSFASDDVGTVAATPVSGRVFAVAFADAGAGDRGTIVFGGPHALLLQKVTNNEVRLWNRTSETLELLLSVDQ